MIASNRALADFSSKACMKGIGSTLQITIRIGETQLSSQRQQLPPSHRAGLMRKTMVVPTKHKMMALKA